MQETSLSTWHKTEITRIANMQFITAARGERQLLRDNYLYHKNKSLNNGSSYWECKERRSANGCNVKIALDEQTHAPNPETVCALKLHSKMKRDVCNTSYTTTNNIITTNIGELAEGLSKVTSH